MLYHLRAENPVELAVRLLRQGLEKVCHLRSQPLMPAERHGFFAEIDPPRPPAPPLSHRFEKLTAPAADIEHVFTALEIRLVEREVPPHILFCAAETFRKAPVIEILFCRAGRRRRYCLRRRCRHQRSPLPDDPQLI